MKKRYFKRIYSIGILFALLLSSQNILAQVVAGHHTVGSGQTFADLTEVRDTLEGYGIAGDGHVYFDIVDGTYDWGGIMIDVVLTNVDASNTITIQSENLNASLVTLETSTANQLFNFTNCDYITVQHLTLKNNNSGTYARAFYLGEAAKNITIKHNIYWGYGSATTDQDYSFIYTYYSNGDFDNLIVDSNTVYDGSNLIYVATNVSNISTGCKFRGNTVNSFGGLQLSKFNEVEVSGNKITCSNAVYAIYLYACNSGLNISNNLIHATYTSTSYGIRLNTCVASGGSPSLIYNNSITLDGGTDDTRTGIRLDASEHQRFFHNSVYLAEANTTSYAIYAQDGANIWLYNNNFVVEHGGYAIGCSAKEPDIIALSDHNNFYCEGNYLANWEGALLNDISVYKPTSNLDAASVSVYPFFNSSTELMAKSHYLDNTSNDVGVTTDINGNARTEFDIGAFEFEPGYSTVYSSDLTIDPSGSGDFFTLAEAADSLAKLGVSAPITVNFVDGIHEGLAEIKPIPGVSAVNTITFQSDAGNANTATIEYSSITANDNYLVYINNSDYLTFDNLIFNNPGVSFARIIVLNANAHDITFTNCIFNGNGIGENTNDRTIISCYSDDLNNFTATSNVFNNGSRGIYFTGASVSDYSTNLNISDNEFNGQRSNIYIRYFNNIDIVNNTCTGFNYAGIKFNVCSSPYTINNNKLSTTLAAESGIHLDLCMGNSQDALIYNNFVHIDNDGQVKAIFCEDSQYQNFYYNSVNVISSNISSTAFYHDVDQTTEKGLVCKNNIFNNIGPGYAFSTWWATGTIDAMDYNNYYSLGSNILYWRVGSGTVNYHYYSNVNDFFAVEGRGEHSQNYNPVFASESDLHANSYWLDNKGTPLTVPLIDKDIDDGDRDATNPDMGADEYVATLLPYSGEYTVGTGGYFDSFNEAIDSLNERGMLDTIYLSALNGTVNEQFTITSFSGLGSDAELVIQSQSGNAENVIFSFDPANGNNYAINIDNADYVTIRNLTFSTGTSSYATAIVFNGNTENVSIYNNVFEGRTTSSNGGEDAIIYAYENSPVLHNLTIRDNVFNNGSRAIYLRNTNGEYAQNVKIYNNTIAAHYTGIELHYTISPEIGNNNISFDVDNGVGINLQYAISGAGTALNLIGNVISSDTYANTYGGIYIRYCDASSSNRALISNNTIRLGSNGLSRSIGLYLSGSDYLDIFHNSVNITNNNYDDRALYSTSSNDIALKNNIFAIRGDLETNFRGLGYAVYFNSGNNIVSDYNNLYTSGNYIAYWQSAKYGTLSEYQTISDQDANSVDIFPAFINKDNLQTQSFFMNAGGTPLTEVLTDINDVSRDGLNPDLGAFEYSDAVTPMSANSYIVGAGGEIPSFDSLMNALYGLGVQGSVVFNVQKGDYSNTSLLFKKIPGTNSNDTVIIQSETGKPEDVSLIYTQDANQNFIILLNGAEYLTLKDMSFVSGGTSYSTIIYVNGNTRNINIINNRLIGSSSTTSSSASRSSIYVENNHIASEFLVSKNSFISNSNGVYFYGWNYNTDNIIIDSNSFIGQYRSVYGYRTNNISIKANTMTNFGNSGVYLQECDGNQVVMANDISTTYDNVNGIYLQNCDGNPGAYGLIANNFVIADGTGSTAYGIRLETCYYQNIFHNTVSITGTHTGSRSFSCWNGESNEIINNIFIANLGYAYVRSGTSPIASSDYNALFTNGTNIALNYQTNYATFAEFQAATFNTDANSVNILPVFASESDLHLADLQLMQLGTPSTNNEVKTDIDGELRDVTTPDIGADEIYARPPMAENVAICEGETTPTFLAIGSNIKWYADELLTQLLFSASAYTPPVTAPGVYTYYVTETIADNESDPTIVILTIYATPAIAEVITNIDCAGNDFGSINITITGDSEIFFYDWSNGSTDEDISKLEAGEYTVIVSDLNGCQASETYTVSALAVPVLTIITNDSDCTENNGDATVSVTGGVEPYKYAWTKGGETAKIDSLYSGIYVVTVTGDNGCSESAIATINDLGGAIITDEVNDVTCYGDSDGAINLTVEGGVLPYTMKWSNGAITEDINQLYAGPYEITVVDNDECKSIKSIKVNQPDAIFIDLDAFDSNCSAANGKAIANVSGGIPAYVYSWSNGSSVDEAVDLGLGVYRVTVTDDNSCTAIKSFSISEIGAPTIKVDSVVQGNCGSADGGIYITAYGGVGSIYTYSWSDFSKEEDLTDVNPGEYSVTVTDSLSCSGAEVEIIPADKPETSEICIVSVDTATNYNEVVWEKPVTTEIDYYNIYKESTQSGIYLLAGAVQYEDESLFLDENSNALQRSSRYKISAVDICGVESDLSAHHKTMHLTLNYGLNNSVNLIWDHYEGFEISTYYIHRYTASSGWMLYDSIQSNLTSFTDENAPIDSLFYLIEINHPYGCTATKAVNKRSSRSNTGSIMNGEGGVLSDAAEIVSFTLAEQTGVATINSIESTVSVLVTDGTILTALTPTIAVSDGASIDPNSGINQDFTNSVVYTVTAESGTGKQWTVTVQESSAALFKVTFNITSNAGVVGGAKITFNGSVQFTDVDGVASFNDQSVGNDISYIVTKSGYNDFSGTLNIVNADVTESVSLTPVGVESTIQNSLSIYPNPNDGRFYLIFEETKTIDVELRIYNSQGMVVKSESLRNKVGKVSEEIIMESEAKGIYFIHISSKEFSTNRKIIVQ